MTTKNESDKLVRAVKAIGIRAVKVVERAAGGAPWTEDAVSQAADWLEAGAKEGGVNRPWPNLAARLRNVVKGTARAVKNAEKSSRTTQARGAAAKTEVNRKPMEPDGSATMSQPAPNSDATPPVDPAALPFSEFVEKYLKRLEKEGKSRGTVFSYSLDLNVAARHFGEARDVKSITVEDVAAYFECDAVTKNRGGGPKNAITVAKLRRTLRMALEWGAKAGWLWTAPIPVTAKVKEAADAAKAAHDGEEAPPPVKRKRGRPEKKDATEIAPAAPSAT